MSIHFPTLIVILGCALVTVVPRIVPFLVVRNIALPEPVLKWLSYIPICILTALVVENFIIQANDSVKINWPVIISSHSNLTDCPENKKLIHHRY